MTRQELKEMILEIVGEQEPVNGRYSLASIGFELKKKGFDARKYGIDKLSQFFELLSPFVVVIRDTTKNPPLVYVTIDSNQEIPSNVDNVLENEIPESIFKGAETEKLADVFIHEFRDNKFRFWKNAIFSIMLVLVSISLSALLLMKLETKKYEGSFSKQVKVDMIAAIKNGANLPVIKKVYSQRDKYESNYGNSISMLLDAKKRGISIERGNYPGNTTLSDILDECEKDYFVSGSKDSLYLSKLRVVIEENQLTNPFDDLDANQKFIFENIRQKLDTNYTTVQGDFNKVADELKQKNRLVTDYLAQSRLSFWISIIALISSLVISGYQIYQGYKSNKSLVDSINSIRDIQV